MFSSSDPIILTLQILVLLFSVVIHEVMHGVVALRFGDHTAQRAGRLTLNPLPHIDLFGTILLPALLILSHTGVILAAAKPVPINPLNFTNLRKGELYVSAAGIIANLCLAIIGAVIFHLSNNFFAQPYLIFIAVYMVKLNLGLAIFNLIPIPPLDGSKIVMSQLSYRLANEYAKLEPVGLFIILGLLYFHILDIIWYLVLPPLYQLLLQTPAI